MTNPRLRPLVLALACLLLGPFPALGDEAAWKALESGGAVVILRHARAPGIGDPPQFRLGDCSTQRNLSDAGRAQAAALGARFRARAIPVVEVRSSRWCRALDTATLAFPALIVAPESALDSFFADRGGGAEQTEQVRAIVQGWAGRRGTLVLVSHQVNISALTRASPQEGETVVLRPRPGAGFELVGSIKP